MSDEQAKAVKEVAKSTGKAIDTVQSAGRFLTEILGGAMREVGGIGLEKAQFWRYRNQITIIDKIQAIHQKRQIEGKATPMPPAFALQALDAIALESENEIQDLWAGLIANATDPNTRIRIRKVFLEVLRGLEPLDARIMDYLCKPGHDKRYSFQTGAKLNAEELASKIEADCEEVKISLQTLARYGCIIDSWENTLDRLDYGYAGFRVSNPSSNFRLSHLGKELVKATQS